MSRTSSSGNNVGDSLPAKGEDPHSVPILGKVVDDTDERGVVVVGVHEPTVV